VTHKGSTAYDEPLVPAAWTPTIWKAGMSIRQKCDLYLAVSYRLAWTQGHGKVMNLGCDLRCRNGG
jgi:hypothetical protein